MEINDYRHKSYKKTLAELDAGDVFYLIVNDEEEEQPCMVLDTADNCRESQREDETLCVCLTDGYIFSYDDSALVQRVKCELIVKEDLR